MEQADHPFANVDLDYPDMMRALAAMPGVPGHPCDVCCGTGAAPHFCCDGRECGCCGQPIDYAKCSCGTPFPTKEQLLPLVSREGSDA